MCACACVRCGLGADVVHVVGIAVSPAQDTLLLPEIDTHTHTHTHTHTEEHTI